MSCLTVTEDVRRVRLALKRAERAIQSANSMGCSVVVDISSAIKQLKNAEHDALLSDVSTMTNASILLCAGRIARIVACRK